MENNIYPHYREYNKDLNEAWQKADYRYILENTLLHALMKLNWLKRILNSSHLNPNARTVSREQTDLDYIETELCKVLSDINSIEKEFKAINNNHNDKRIKRMKRGIKELLTKKENLEGYSVSHYEYWINHF